MPFQHSDTILTGTDILANLFALRCHPDAEPHFRLLAWKMADLYYTKEPVLCGVGEWHLPYVSVEEKRELPLYVQVEVSCARCARVSYAQHDGSNPDPNKDRETYRKLLKPSEDPLEPIHGSALEHTARPVPGKHGKHQGWLSHRMEQPNEHFTSFNYLEAIARGWRDEALQIESIQQDWY
jgi:hypothetical protein